MQAILNLIASKKLGLKKSEEELTTTRELPHTIAVTNKAKRDNIEILEFIKVNP